MVLLLLPVLKQELQTMVARLRALPMLVLPMPMPMAKVLLAPVPAARVPLLLTLLQARMTTRSTARHSTG